MQVPVIHLDRVLHVGTMSPAKLGANGASQEGHCLSVSLCPDAWRQIARLGGNPVHELTREGGAFLDVHAVIGDAELLESAIDWAVAEGLAERKTLWRAWSYDEDAEAWGYMTCDAAEKAFAEVNYDGEFEEPEDVPGPDGMPGIEPMDATVGTPALAAATGVRHDPQSDATDDVLMAWARSVASERVPGGLDGVWWRENYDPDSLSAPRAGIFPDRAAAWNARKVSWKSVDDEVEMEAMPDAVLHGEPAAPSFR